MPARCSSQSRVLASNAVTSALRSDTSALASDTSTHISSFSNLYDTSRFLLHAWSRSRWRTVRLRDAGWRVLRPDDPTALNPRYLPRGLYRSVCLATVGCSCLWFAGGHEQASASRGRADIENSFERLQGGRPIDFPPPVSFPTPPQPRANSLAPHGPRPEAQVFRGLRAATGRCESGTRPTNRFLPPLSL